MSKRVKCWYCPKKNSYVMETSRVSKLCLSCERYIKIESEKDGNLRYKLLQRNILLLQQKSCIKKKFHRKKVNYTIDFIDYKKNFINIYIFIRLYSLI